jgi:hypothetical protein
MIGFQMYYLSKDVDQRVLTKYAHPSVCSPADFVNLWRIWTPDYWDRCDAYFWEWRKNKQNARHMRRAIAHDLLHPANATPLRLQQAFLNDIYVQLEWAVRGFIRDELGTVQSALSWGRVNAINREATTSNHYITWSIDASGHWNAQYGPAS